MSKLLTVINTSFPSAMVKTIIKVAVKTREYIFMTLWMQMTDQMDKQGTHREVYFTEMTESM